VPYAEQSIARRLLENDPDSLAQVIRWISVALTAPRFWSLRAEWPDLLQEVLSRVVESLRQGRFDASRDFRVYVQGIARNAAMEAVSRSVRSAHPGQALDLLRSADPSPESEAIRRQLAQRILSLASDECRQLIHLYYFQARSYDEIATAMDLPVGTVKSRLFRCLESVHHLLSRRAERSRAQSVRP
jgi:RNA polymerase sigma factor (sigma-70 family)